MYAMTLIQVILSDCLILDELDLSPLVFLLGIRNRSRNRQRNAGLSELHQIGDQLGLEVTMEDGISFFGDAAAHNKPIISHVGH